MTDIAEWFKNLPLFTRYWFSLSIVFPLIARFGLINAYYFYLIPDLVIWHFQIWRPFTALFFYPVQAGFRFLANLYFLYNYSIRLETGLFDGKPADYGFLLVFSWACTTIVALLAEMPLLMDSMVMVVIYIWCQLNQDTVVTFWFGTQFKFQRSIVFTIEENFKSYFKEGNKSLILKSFHKTYCGNEVLALRAMYLPWIVAAFEFVMSGGFLPQLVGIFVGHLYFFLKFKYPIDFGGPDLLATPQFLYNYLPNRRGVTGFGQAPASARTEGQDQRGGGGGGGRHSWGRGQTLGEN